MPPSRSHRRPVVLLATLVAALVPAGAAQAGGACPQEATSHPFVLYLDTAPYFIAHGGDFEGERTTWATTGGAGLQPQARINDYGGAQVMRLPLWSTTTSLPICVDATRTKLRFDVRAASLLSRLRVDAVLPGGRTVALGGHTAVLDTLLWGLTAPIPLAGPLGVN